MKIWCTCQGPSTTWCELDQQGQHSCWLYDIENSCFLHPEQLSQLGPSLGIVTIWCTCQGPSTTWSELDQQGQHSCWLYYIENSCFLHPEQLSQLGPSLELTTVDAYQLTLYDIAIAGLALQPTICCLKLKQSITDALCRKVVSSTSGLATLPKKFLLQSWRSLTSTAFWTVWPRLAPRRWRSLASLFFQDYAWSRPRISQQRKQEKGSCLARKLW